MTIAFQDVTLDGKDYQVLIDKSTGRIGGINAVFNAVDGKWHTFSTRRSRRISLKGPTAAKIAAAIGREFAY